MDITTQIKRSENLHILLWLIKDMCWLNQWVLAGTIVFFPTLILAIYICYKTKDTLLSFLVNLAVLAWIIANSCWMLGDFYKLNLNTISTLFFAFGVILMLYYVGLILYKKQTDT
jgi:hypothetical protein